MTDGPVTSFPATPTQEALWWWHQRAVRKSVYHITWRMGCAAAPDLAVLRGAWQAVVDRHDAARMSIDLRDGALTATVLPHVDAPTRSVAIEDPGSTPVAALLSRIAEEVHDEPMPPDRAPLARLTAVRVGAEHELLLTVHHAAVDGWGMQVLMGDLSTAYEALARGAEPSFDTVPGSFPDYARDLRQAGERGRWHKSVDHWRAALDGATGVTVAPDRPRRAKAGGAGTTARYEFSREAAAGMAVLARAATTTPFAVVLAALEIVLARGGAGPDVTVATPAANRMTKRDQRIVGYLANLCLLRTVVDADDTVADVVGRARDALWQVLAHQAAPYPTVFAALPESTRTALGDIPPVVLTYLGSIGADLRLGDIPLTLHRSPNRAARSDLTIGYWDGDGGILAEVEYSVDRYDRPTVLRLLHDVDTVLATGGEDPGRTVGSLALRTRTVAGRDPATGDQVHRALPESTAFRHVAQAWEQVLGHPPTGPDQDFFADGGGSLKVLQLATAIESAAGARLDLVTWLAEPTPRRIADQLTGGDVPTGAPGTLVTLREGAGPHLHLVHGAGGSPQDYLELVAALPAHWRVTASRERAPLDSVAAMAAAYRADLDAAGLRPDVLGGWSFGGLVAFEMASGHPSPAPGLVLIDSPPPVGYPVDEEATRQRLADFVAIVGASVEAPPDSSPPVSTDDVTLAVRALAASLAVAGEEIPAWALIERWRAYQRHALAGSGYVADRPLSVPGVVVGADLTDDELDQWARLFTPPPRVLRVDTDHVGVVRAPAVARIAAAVHELMASRV